MSPASDSAALLQQHRRTPNVTMITPTRTRGLICWHALVVSLVCLFTGCKYKKDAAVLHTFQTHFAALSNVVGVLHTYPEVERIDWTSGIVIINTSHTNPPVLTEQVRPPLKSIGQDLVISHTREGIVMSVFFSSPGPLFGGSSKGIVYRQLILHRTVHVADQFSPTISPDLSPLNKPFTILRPLDTNWSSLQTNWFIGYAR